MDGSLRLPSPRWLTVAGLVIGAIGIGILWASGVAFPVYPPPGIVILALGALLVAGVKRPWAPGVGAFLGLFVLVGFGLSSLTSGAGTDNLLGREGTGAVVGTVVQLIGVVTALVAGLLAVSRDYRQRPIG
jgi:hypothetical protein